MYLEGMKLIRYSTPGQPISWGVLDDGYVKALVGDVLASWTVGESVGRLADVLLHAPCAPSKVVCVAINYEGIDGFSQDMLEPMTFIKPGSSIVGPDAVVSNPFPGSNWWGEAELGVVIKKQARGIQLEQVQNYVLGLTIGNDVTVENCDERDHHLVRSKGADGFCPLGPWIETDFPEESIRIRAIQDGECVREGWSHQQFWDWRQIVSSVSQWMTLEPFDVVLTGNVPDTMGMRYLGAGAVFEAEISGLGVLKTTFIGG